MTEEESKAAKAIDYLMAKCHNTAVKKGWWEKGSRNDGELHMLIVTELAESFEHLRHGDRMSDHIPDFTGREEELADVLIRIFDYAEQQQLNLKGALLAKMAFNETREYRHGGKRA
jgi:NTP pyrophosphatase (non-canonical NTP hydrolase)